MLQNYEWNQDSTIEEVVESTAINAADALNHHIAKIDLVKLGDTYVAGTAYHRIPEVKVGTWLNLGHVSNPYDVNAVAFRVNGDQIGGIANNYYAMGFVPADNSKVVNQYINYCNNTQVIPSKCNVIAQINYRTFINGHFNYYVSVYAVKASLPAECQNNDVVAC